MELNINDSGFFYQDTAKIIVDKILECFKNNEKHHEDYVIWDYPIPISDEEENYHHVNWYFKIVRADTKEKDFKYSFFGSAGRDFCDEPSIDISIVIPKGKHQNKIRIDRSELFDVVSHELHHIAQNTESNSFYKENKHKGRLAYFLDPLEIEAFHIGIRAQSSLSGKIFEDIAQKYLDDAWPEGSQIDKDIVIKAWKNTDFPVFNQNINQ